MIEFLLVQTRRGLWTFPKGRAEPGLTHAQAAALEAFEEAGVHGRMEEASFAQYVYRKRRGERRASADLAVSAHLCEVLRLEAPEEAHRTPTWFSPEEAKRCLREDHRAGSGVDMARVVDRAVRRIRQLRNERIATVATRAAQVIEIDDLREMQPNPPAMTVGYQYKLNGPATKKR
jgi:ADP-ribose pyrophosphatase YjhB (NUDIX family)